MKKLLLIAALASMSNPAFASKARMSALGNGEHLVDAQTAFDNPAHILMMSDYVTFEAGPTNSGSPTPVAGAKWSDVSAYGDVYPKSEGGFTKSAGDAKYGVYFGRTSSFTQTYRGMLGFLKQENPLELQYANKGAINWGAALNYSSSDKKASSKKQTAMGARFGATTDTWEAYAIIGLGSTAKGAGAGRILNGDSNQDGLVTTGEFTDLAADSTAEFKGTTGFKLQGKYKMADGVSSFAKYQQDGFEYTSGNTLNGMKVASSQIDLGAIDTNKLDAGNWFYGASVQMQSAKISGISGLNDKTITNTYVPFIVGMEFDVNSTFVLRTSATQNVLIGSEKTDDGNGNGAAAGAVGNFVDEANTVGQNTKVAAGFGIKMNKWIIDGSWAAASSTTGEFNGSSLLTNVGLTYNF